MTDAEMIAEMQAMEESMAVVSKAVEDTMMSRLEAAMSILRWRRMIQKWREELPVE